MWSDPSQYPFEAGKLFLGHKDGQEIGIKTERHAITIAGAGSGKGQALSSRTCCGGRTTRL